MAQHTTAVLGKSALHAMNLMFSGDYAPDADETLDHRTGARTAGLILGAVGLVMLGVLFGVRGASGEGVARLAERFLLLLGVVLTVQWVCWRAVTGTAKAVILVVSLIVAGAVAFATRGTATSDVAAIIGTLATAACTLPLCLGVGTTVAAALAKPRTR